MIWGLLFNEIEDSYRLLLQQLEIVAMGALRMSQTKLPFVMISDFVRSKRRAKVA